MAQTEEMKQTQPMVTVVCITYAHEEFIAQALDSFLAQKNTFPFQIFVGEDKGPDKTAEIVLQYAEKYPDKIVPFIRKENMGAQHNMIDLCSRATSPYIALCEGDDYWVDEYKLQKQYDLMEAHPEYRACFHNTKIIAGEDWYLNGYYRPDKDGVRSIPGSIPGYDRSKRVMRMDYYIKFGPAHTSSMFFRWNYDLEIPDWYYTHIYGDHPLMMMQVGDGLLGYIPEIMSAYRRSDVGVLMHDNIVEHFIRTRESWIEMAMDLEDYFKQHYGDFANRAIQERIAVEFTNYVKYMIQKGYEDKLPEIFEKYQYAGVLTMKYFIKMRTQYNNMLAKFGEDGMKYINGNAEELRAQIERDKLRMKRNAESKELRRRADYVKLADTKKDDRLWVFGTEGNKAFANNTRHLFEHIIAFHPEIQAVWVTRNEEVLKLFRAENLPVCKIGTGECTRLMERAGLAFVNTSKNDIYKIRGFNAGTRVVRLGSGIHIMDFRKPLEPEQAGSREEGKPSRESEFAKEMYENTFLAIAPNAAMAKICRDYFHIPEKSIMINGYPRSFAVKTPLPPYEGKRILYAPQSRKYKVKLDAIMNYLFESSAFIQQWLEEHDAELYIHLEYNRRMELQQKFEQKTAECSRITLLKTRDIFSDLPNFDMMISDYSNIIFDYLMLDRPILLLDIDTKEFLAENRLLIDFAEMTKEQTYGSWSDLLSRAEVLLQHGELDRQQRLAMEESVFERGTNDENNAERIVQELKQRLGLQ